MLVQAQPGASYNFFFFFSGPPTFFPIVFFPELALPIIRCTYLKVATVSGHEFLFCLLPFLGIQHHLPQALEQISIVEGQVVPGHIPAYTEDTYNVRNPPGLGFTMSPSKSSPVTYTDIHQEQMAVWVCCIYMDAGYTSPQTRDISFIQLPSTSRYHAPADPSHSPSQQELCNVSADCQGHGVPEPQTQPQEPAHRLECIPALDLRARRWRVHGSIHHLTNFTQLQVVLCKHSSVSNDDKLP